MIVWDNFHQNVAKIMKIQGLNMLLLSCIRALVYPLYRHWYCAIVGPANSDLADNRIMSFPLCNLNIVAVMVKILLNMKKFSQKKRHFSETKKEKACPSFAPTVCTHKKNGLSPCWRTLFFAITICVLDRKNTH